MSDSITEDIPYKQTFTEDIIDIKKYKQVANQITDINIIFILHIDKQEIQFIEADIYDPSLPNIFFYIHKDKKKKKNSYLKLRLVVHLKEHTSGTYSINPIQGLHKTITGDSSAPATKEEVASETEPEEASEAKPQAASETEPEEASKAKPQAASETEPEEASKAKLQAASETEPEEASKAKPQAASETEPEVKSSAIKKTTYTYNPEDIYTLLPKIKIKNTVNIDDTMNGEYLIGKPFGYKHQYQNIYSQVGKSEKYKLSGRVHNVDETTKKITWLRLIK